MEEKRKIYSVGELNHAARLALEQGIGEVWVEGEISRLTRHASGHWYFTLKDEAAAVSCAMFKPNNALVLFHPQDGLKVRVLGQASLYEARGNYQLIAHKMEEAGKGNLQEQFEKLKAKLAAEGLFDESRKKPLPMLPQRIGVVTSPTGAAVRDIINVLTRRFPNLEVLLAPVTVQGATAAKSIAAAIRYLNVRPTRSTLPNVEHAARLHHSGENERDARSTLPPEDARSTFFNPLLPLDIHERNLPHWEQPGNTYFITFRLADSIPQKKLTQWQNERETWLEKHETPYSDDEKNEYHQLFSERVNAWLDAGSGSCLLADKENAKIIANALTHFDGERYSLGEWVIMPNHVHLLVTPNETYLLKDILQTWKSFSAHEINKRTGESGQVWQHESYDHIVRSPEQKYHFELYIHNNPTEAGVKVEQASRLLHSGENERDAHSTLPNVEQAARLHHSGENERDARSTLDLLIVGRGGGSLEDLWAFNEEVVARAIAESEIPIISAVGHEIDFTIADFVADLRAPTPSAAAELAVPVKIELENNIRQLTTRLSGSLQNRTLVLKEKIPGFRQTMTQLLRTALQQRQQRIDEAALCLTHALQNAIAIQKQRLPGLQQTMTHHLQRAVAERKQTLKRLEAQLRVLSPLGVLERGYSLTETEDGTVVHDASLLKEGDILQTRFAKGTVRSEVKTSKEPL